MRLPRRSPIDWIESAVRVDDVHGFREQRGHCAQVPQRTVVAKAPCPVTAAAATSLCTSAKRASPESIISALTTLPRVFACVTDHAAPRGRNAIR